MDIKKLLFKYADKAAFGLLLLLLICAVANSPFFGETFRPIRDILNTVTWFLPSSGGESFDQAAQLRKVKELQEKIEDQLKISKPTPEPELKQAAMLKTPPEEVHELRAHEWGAPTDIIEQPVKITATVPWPLPLKEKMDKGFPPKVTTGAERLKVSVKGPRELELVGQGEGKAEFEWRDTTNVRHVQTVDISKFVAQAIVSPPANLKATMEKAAVHLVWDPTTPDPRAPVTSYNVYRRGADETEPKKIATVNVSQGKTGEGGASPEGATAGAAPPKGGGEYTDSSIQFDTSYVYTVKSVAPKADPSESQASAPAQIDIPSDSDFFVKGVMDRNGLKNASIKVYKLVNKEWRFRNFNGLTPGEGIGGIHSVPARRDKPAETVDYRTGATLVDIDANASRASLTIMARSAGIEGGQLKTIDVVTPRPNPYRGKIVYLDRRGELREKWMGKEALDELDRRFGINVGAAKAEATPAPTGLVAPPPTTGAPEEKKPEVLKPETVK